MFKKLILSLSLLCSVPFLGAWHIIPTLYSGDNLCADYGKSKLYYRQHVLDLAYTKPGLIGVEQKAENYVGPRYAHLAEEVMLHQSPSDDEISDFRERLSLYKSCVDDAESDYDYIASHGATEGDNAFPKSCRQLSSMGV